MPKGPRPDDTAVLDGAKNRLLGDQSRDGINFQKCSA